MIKLKQTIAFVAASALTAPALAASANPYSIINLNDKFGDLFASSINDQGQIAGSNQSGLKIFSINHQTQSLTTEFVPSGPSININNRGEVAATMSPKGDLNNYFAAKWEGTDLMPLASSGVSIARGINDNGLVAGTVYATSAPFQSRAAVWDNAGNIKYLDSLNENGRNDVAGINNNGFVLGWSDQPNAGRHTVIWSPDGSITQIGSTAGSVDFSPTGINNLNQATGYASTSSAIYSVFWDGSSAINIGSLNNKNTQSMDINDHGDIVGTSAISSDDNGNAIYHAFLWNSDSGITDLNQYMPGSLAQSGWILTNALDINNNDQILVSGTNLNTNQNATFYMTHISPVPEPSTWMMMILGIGMIGIMAKTSRKSPDLI